MKAGEITIFISSTLKSECVQLVPTSHCEVDHHLSAFSVQHAFLNAHERLTLPCPLEHLYSILTQQLGSRCYGNSATRPSSSDGERESETEFSFRLCSNNTSISGTLCSRLARKVRAR